MSYYHLTTEERSCIFQFMKLGMGVREIGRALKRSPSTISRELKRNSADSNPKSSYFPTLAQSAYEKRREKCHRNINLPDDTKEYIKNRIADTWSPEEIYHRKTKEVKYVPSTSSIYRYIHKGLIEKTEMKLLRRKGNFKRPAETRGRFNDKGRTIKKRPKKVYKRKELGHWEGDTVESGRLDHKRKSKYCFVTLCERVSRKYIAVLVPTRTADDVTPAIIEALKDYPDDMVKTITFDRGKEFCNYEEIEEKLNCKTYFCNPYCAWQKGTNENSNGLLREFYPKGMDLSEVKKEDLEHNLELMNNRPRKCMHPQNYILYLTLS